MSEKEKKSIYEGMFILSSALSEEARQKALDRITSGISERGGEVNKIHDQGRRKLAYEINGKREGHYFLIYFTIPTPAIPVLWRDYHLNEDLIRFGTFQADAVLEKIEFKSIALEKR
jgi:small subunit ribosomal protein S6